MEDWNGTTALMIAIRNKSSTASAYAVRTLLGLGADAKLADVQGNTALHWAAQCDQPEVIDVLLGAGCAALNVVNRLGDTAYVTAVKYNSPAALQCLIDAGCDRMTIDGLMGTAVSLAAVKVNHPTEAHVLHVLVALKSLKSKGESQVLSLSLISGRGGGVTAPIRSR